MADEERAILSDMCAIRKCVVDGDQVGAAFHRQTPHVSSRRRCRSVCHPTIHETLLRIG